jgi:hypothetical protein
MKKVSGAFFMLVLGLLALGAHYYFGWNAFQADAQSHNETAHLSEYHIEWGRDVFENLQSEFIQLFFQFLVLAGVLKFMGIEAYEADMEEVKNRLSAIEISVAQAVNK